MVEDHFHAAVLEQRGVFGEKFVQALLYRRADLDGVGVAFLEDRDLDALAAVNAGDEVALAMAAEDATDVLELDRRAVNLADDDFADLVDALEFVEGPDEELGFAVLEHSAGQVDVFRGEAVGDLADGDAEVGQALGFDLDLDLFL